MKNIIFIILSLWLFVGVVSGQEENYIDSVFQAELASEQLKDSTLSDRMYYHLYKGIQYVNTDKQKSLDHFLTCLYMDSAVTHPKIYAAAAYQAYKLFQSEKNYNEAYFFLNSAYKHNPQNITYLEDLAWFEFSIQNYQQSIQYFKRINKLSPLNSEYIYGLSQAYLKNKEYKKALKELQKYEQLEGSSVQILGQRAEIWYTAGKPDKAIVEVKQYIDNNNDEYLEGSFLLSQLYMLNQQQQKSIDLLTELDRQYPGNASILIAIADYYKKNGDDDNQKDYVMKAIRSKNIPVKNLSSLIRPVISGLLQNGDKIQIYDILDTLTAIYPHQVDVMILQADTYRAMEDTVNLRTVLYELREIKHDENIDLQLIDIAEKNQNENEVRKLTAEGYSKFKTDKWAYFHIISLAEENLFDSLINVSRNLLPSINDKFIKSRVYQLLGDIYSTQSADSLAFAMYDSCLLYDPNNTGALNNLAYNMTKHAGSDMNKAEKMAYRALELEPESTTILDTYAWILYLRGDYRLALIYFDKLVRIAEETKEQQSIEVLYHRGCVFYKLGEIETAEKLWHEALKIYDENRQPLFKEIEMIHEIKKLLLNETRHD